MYRIVRRQQFSDTTFLWDVHAPDVAKAAQPGHFVMVRLREGGERIPLTVADFDREWGTITMVVQAVGKTTREMLQDYAEGDTFLDFVGRSASPATSRRLATCPRGRRPRGRPRLPAAARLQGGRQPHHGDHRLPLEGPRLLGGQVQEFCDDLIVCTDDGSYGRPGFVTAALKDSSRRRRPTRSLRSGRSR